MHWDAASFVLGIVAAYAPVLLAIAVHAVAEHANHARRGRDRDIWRQREGGKWR